MTTFEESLNEFFKDSDKDTNFMFVGLISKTSLNSKQKRELIDRVYSKKPFQLKQKYTDLEKLQIENIMKFIIKGCS